MTRPASTTVWQYALTAALVLILTSVAMDAHCSEVAKPAAIYLSLSAADLASTRYAIRNGATEGNGFMAHNAAPKQLALAGLLTFADVKLKRPGQKRALRITVAAIRLAAIGINVHNARRK